MEQEPIKKVDVCRKCVEIIPEDEPSIEIANIFLRGKYHLECYKKNKKTFKWFIIASYAIPIAIFLIMVAIMLGIIFGVVVPKMSHF